MTWADLSFSKFCQIKPGMPVLDILAIIENKTREQIGAERRDLEKDLAGLSFLNDQLPQTVWSEARPNLELETIGQFEDLKATAALLKGEPDDLHHFPDLYACYITKDYDDKTADKFRNMIGALPCTQVVGTVNHYLKELDRIETKWTPLYPKGNYTNEQRAAGFDQLAETFKFAATLWYVESRCPYTRDQILKWTVGEFKYYLLYLARESEAQKKYAEIQQGKMQQARKRK